MDLDACGTRFSVQRGAVFRPAPAAGAARIDWKYVLALELTDPGFGYVVLSEFCSRRATGNRSFCAILPA